MGYIIDDFAPEIERLEPLVGENLLTEWEEVFILEMTKRPYSSPLSSKQVLVLEDLLEKAQKRGWFGPC
jgi:hypothetical protein